MCGNQLQGIIRVVGDGYTIVWIQDILVFPDQQRKGVGSALIQPDLIFGKAELWEVDGNI